MSTTAMPKAAGKSEVSYFPDGFHISFSVAVAHDRLRSLRHSVEDCHCHKRKVRDHSVSRHTDISHKTEHQEIDTVVMTPEEISPTNAGRQADTPE